MWQAALTAPASLSRKTGATILDTRLESDPDPDAARAQSRIRCTTQRTACAPCRRSPSSASTQARCARTSSGSATCKENDNGRSGDRPLSFSNPIRGCLYAYVPTACRKELVTARWKEVVTGRSKKLFTSSGQIHRTVYTGTRFSLLVVPMTIGTTRGYYSGYRRHGAVTVPSDGLQLEVRFSRPLAGWPAPQASTAARRRRAVTSTHLSYP